MEVNKKTSAQVTGDENADGWLSTRNKKKIPRPLSRKQGQQPRHFSRSPLVSLVNESPPQLNSAKKQTSIVDFLNPPHQKPLSPPQKQSTVSCSHPPENRKECSIQHGSCLLGQRNTNGGSVLGTGDSFHWPQSEIQGSTMPEGALSETAHRQTQEEVRFSDSLQTPEFLQGTFNSFDIDEPTLLEFPRSEDWRNKPSDFSFNNSEALPESVLQTTKENKSSLEMNIDDLNPCSDSGDEATFGENADHSPEAEASCQTSKENKSSLEMNTYHCSSSPHSSDEETICESTHSSQTVPRKRKRHSISFSGSKSKIYFDDLHTPEFLIDLDPVDSGSLDPDNTEKDWGEQRFLQSSDDLETPDFLSACR